MNTARALLVVVAVLSAREASAGFGLEAVVGPTTTPTPSMVYGGSFRFTLELPILSALEAGGTLGAWTLRPGVANAFGGTTTEEQWLFPLGVSAFLKPELGPGLRLLLGVDLGVTFHAGFDRPALALRFDTRPSAYVQAGVLLGSLFKVGVMWGLPNVATPNQNLIALVIGIH